MSKNDMTQATPNDLNKKSAVNDGSKNSFGSTGLPPKLKKTRTNEQLNQSINAVGKKVDHVSDQMFTQKQAQALTNKQDLEKSTEDIKRTVRNQSDKQIKASIDGRNIAYNAGTQDSIRGLRQQVDGFQIRMDNQTRNVSDIVRENDALNADLKGISKNLQSNTISNNRVAGVIKSLLLGGIQVSTTDVTRSVVDDLNKITGYSIASLIKGAVHEELEQRIKEVKQVQNVVEQSKDIVSYKEKQCEKYAKNSEQLVYKVLRCINRGVIEFAAIWLVSVVTTGWWRILTIMLVAGVCWFFNKGVDDL